MSNQKQSKQVKAKKQLTKKELDRVTGGRNFTSMVQVAGLKKAVKRDEFERRDPTRTGG